MVSEPRDGLRVCRDWGLLSFRASGFPVQVDLGLWFRIQGFRVSVWVERSMISDSFRMRLLGQWATESGWAQENSRFAAAGIHCFNSQTRLFHVEANGEASYGPCNALVHAVG